MKRELQDKINRAVALRDEAFHECLNAIREVLKANGGFLTLHCDGRRATVRALVWSEYNEEYIDQDIHAVRLNGKDDDGEDVVEMFADSFICDFTREEMESLNKAKCWHPVSVDSESIYPMAPVFELAYWIDDFVAENLPKGYREAAHEIVGELIDAQLITGEPQGIDWETTIAKILKKTLGANGYPSPSGNELADARKDYIGRLVKVIEPFVPCKVEVEHEDGVLSDNKATYSIEKDENGNLLFTDLETMISFPAEAAVDGELYAIAEKLTHKD